MAKKPNVLPHPQNALNKFMVRIIIERDRLNDAFALDGNTISIFKVKPHSGTRSDSDDVGGLADSHLEDMYHSLYGEPLELRKLLIDAKGESVKAGVEFKLILNPLLNAMFQVHESCIEGLRTGNGWNTEAHCKAFEELFQELGTYNERINQIVANPAVKSAEPQPIAKKKNANYERDLFMYDLAVKGELWKDIRALVRKRFKVDCLDSDSAAQKAVKRFIKNQKLHDLQPRKRG